MLRPSPCMVNALLFQAPSETPSAFYELYHRSDQNPLKVIALLLALHKRKPQFVKLASFAVSGSQRTQYSHYCSFVVNLCILEFF
jgi:hypothetical protein